MSKEYLETKPSKKGPLSRSYKSALYGIGIVLVTGLIFYGGQIIGGALSAISLIIGGYDPDSIESLFSDSLFVQLFATAVISAVSIFLLVIVAKKIFGNSHLKSALLLKPIRSRQILEVFGVYGMYFLCAVVVSIVASTSTSIDVNQTQELGIAQTTTILDKFIVFCMLAIFPPIYEELLFRGFLYNALRKNASIAVSVIVTSLLFGAAHLEFTNLNWIAAVDTCIFSVFLIYLSQKHHSLYSAVFLHMLKNSIAFYVLFVHG
jgi:membrane protease YdiL (CAAX protease family)